MHTASHARIGSAAKIPVSEPTPIISYSPVVVPASDRPVNLEVRVTFPSTTTNNDAPLPVILLAHGQGPSNYLSSLEGYAPLAEFYAAHGFAVLQPTHLSSAFLGLTWPTGQELFWQERAHDMVRLLDNLSLIEETVPGLAKGRLDRDRVAIVGHSAGTMSVSGLLGGANTDPRTGEVWNKPERRIKVGVSIGGIGNGGEDLSEVGKGLLPFFNPDFTSISAPLLVVWGDEDVSPHLTDRGADWHADMYRLAPGPKDSLEMKGAKHGFGGISGWDAGETRDESPERLGVVQRMTWAYVRSQLYEGDSAWADACEAFNKLTDQGKLERKE